MGKRISLLYNYIIIVITYTHMGASHTCYIPWQLLVPCRLQSSSHIGNPVHIWPQILGSADSVDEKCEYFQHQQLYIPLVISLQFLEVIELGQQHACLLKSSRCVTGCEYFILFMAFHVITIMLTDDLESKFILIFILKSWLRQH